LDPVLPERRHRPAATRPSLRNKQNKKLVEPAPERVSTPSTEIEQEQDNPDLDEEQPTQRGFHDLLPTVEHQPGLNEEERGG
jgi:hypothetical protein